MINDLIDSFIEIDIGDDANFLKIKETLTRIGIASKKENKLYQSCHILHKQGKYYLVHFKEMFKLDNKTTNLLPDDIARRNRIALLLKDWNLLRIICPKDLESNVAPMSSIKVISYNEKPEWNLESKYTIGKKVYNKN